MVVEGASGIREEVRRKDYMLEILEGEKRYN
jgi:hypothetical protein